jgi:hypothetical protein
MLALFGEVLCEGEVRVTTAMTQLSGGKKNGVTVECSPANGRRRLRWMYRRHLELGTAWGGLLTCLGKMRAWLGELQRRWVPDKHTTRQCAQRLNARSRCYRVGGAEEQYQLEDGRLRTVLGTRQRLHVWHRGRHGHRVGERA